MIWKNENLLMIYSDRMYMASRTNNKILYKYIYNLIYKYFMYINDLDY